MAVSKNKVIFDVLANTKNYSKGMGKTADLTNAATKAMKFGFVALSTTVIASTVALGKFEKGMSNISTLIDTSKEDIKGMGQEILKMSQEVPKPISEMVESMYDIRSAGVSAAEAMGTLNSAGKLAVVGLSSTKEATDILTTSINSFKSEGLSASQISNILFKTVKYGKNTIAQLSQAFGQTAPLAKAAGVSLSEFSAATAALTAQGIPASVAQNQIRAAMVSLGRQTASMKRVFKKLGYKDMRDLMKNSENLGDAFAKIKNAADELDIPLSKVTGRVEGANAITVIATEGAEIYNNALSDMKSGADAVSEAFKKQSATMDAQKQIATNYANTILINFGEKIQSSVIQTGDVIIDALKEINKSITENGPKITSVFSFITDVGMDLFDSFKYGIGIAKDLFNVLGGVAILKSIAGIFKILSIGIKASFIILKQITSGFSDLLDTLGPVGTGIKGILAAMALMKGYAIAEAIIGIVKATKLWSVASKILNLVLAANPIVLITTAVIGLGAVVYDIITNFNEWRLTFDKLMTTVTIGWKKAKMFFASDETKKALQAEVAELEKEKKIIDAQTEALKKRKDEFKANGMSSKEADTAAGRELASGQLPVALPASVRGAVDSTENVENNLSKLKSQKDAELKVVEAGEQAKFNAIANANVAKMEMEDEQAALDAERVAIWYEEAQAAEAERYAADQEKEQARYQAEMAKLNQQRSQGLISDKMFEKKEDLLDKQHNKNKEDEQKRHYAELRAQNKEYWKVKNAEQSRQNSFEYTVQKNANMRVKALQTNMYAEFKDLLFQAAQYSKTAAKAYKVVAISEAIISTYLAASRALAEMPFPVNIAAAGIVTAKGMLQVYAIKNQQFAVGTDYVPRDMTANIHQGEGIIPAKENQFLQSGKLALVSPDVVTETNNEENNSTQNYYDVSFDGAIINGNLDDDTAMGVADKIATAIYEKRFAGFPAPAE